LKKRGRAKSEGQGITSSGSLLKSAKSKGKCITPSSSPLKKRGSAKGKLVGFGCGDFLFVGCFGGERLYDLGVFIC
jgi:hypothetical protein